MNFARVIESLAGFLEREKIPFALAGAFALHAYGLSRTTVDLDLVVDAGGQGRIVSYMESLGYETLHLSAGFSNHLHPLPDLGRVDFIYVKGETARKLFAAARNPVKLGGRSLPVPSPEHLAAMKVHAMKHDPARALQDMADVRFILLLPGVDREKVRGYFARAGLEEKFREIERSL